MANRRRRRQQRRRSSSRHNGSNTQSNDDNSVLIKSPTGNTTPSMEANTTSVTNEESVHVWNSVDQHSHQPQYLNPSSPHLLYHHQHNGPAFCCAPGMESVAYFDSFHGPDLSDISSPANNGRFSNSLQQQQQHQQLQVPTTGQIFGTPIPSTMNNFVATPNLASVMTILPMEFSTPVEDAFSSYQAYSSLNPLAVPFVPRSLTSPENAMFGQPGPRRFDDRPVPFWNRGSHTSYHDNAWAGGYYDNGSSMHGPRAPHGGFWKRWRPIGSRSTGAMASQRRCPKDKVRHRGSQKQRGGNNGGGKCSRADETKSPDSVMIIVQPEDHPPPPCAPRVFYSYGKKVTMVDERNKVFVIDLLSSKTCNQIRRRASKYLQRVKDSHGVVGANGKSWRKLYTYTKMDLPCADVDDLPLMTNQILADIVSIIRDVYGVSEEQAPLRPRSGKEPHLLLYHTDKDKPDHPGVKMHYDGCHITWQAMLSHPDEYEGGGTYFRLLRKTIKLKKGQILVHPGDLYHKGVNIASGARCLLVCFMDGYDPKITDDSKDDDDSEEFEKNVCMY